MIDIQYEGKCIEHIGNFQIDKNWIEINGKMKPGTITYSVTENDEQGWEIGYIGEYKTLKEARAQLKKFL